MESVFKPKHWPLWILAASLLLFESWRLFDFFLAFDGWGRVPLISFLIVLLFFKPLLEAGIRLGMVPFIANPIMSPARNGHRVAVVTTFVPGKESLDVLENTLKALVSLSYTHDTWVLDEGNELRVRQLCESLGAKHFSRLGHAEYQGEDGRYKSGTKYGNYNAWLDAVGVEEYEFLYAFDTDHIPCEGYIDWTIGCFTDDSVGYVQVADDYYNQAECLVARGAREPHLVRNGITQRFYYRLGMPIITGSHNIHRIAALQQVGGFAVHDADDMLLTYEYRASGWRGEFVPEVLAKGRVPTTWYDYLFQQMRWARSQVDIKRKRYPDLAAKLDWKSKLVAGLNGASFSNALAWVFVFLVIIYLSLSGVKVTERPVQFLLQIVELTAVLLVPAGLLRLYLLKGSDKPQYFSMGILMSLVRWPFVLFAVVQGIFGISVKYTVTPKLDKARPGTWLILLVHGPILFLLISSTVVGYKMHNQLDSFVPCLVAIYATVILTIVAWSSRFECNQSLKFPISRMLFDSEHPSATVETS
ncbi:MAG: hypothetical protein NPIRA05_05010 [Nitrospirales bacterium]|nr:MAG: hypothetical protein NPIRA05_05010 [Nitrospirales bacterium]